MLQTLKGDAMKLDWKSDTERYCWENIVAAVILFLVSVLGDIVLWLFNNAHPLHFGAFQSAGTLLSVVIFFRARYYLKYYGE